MSDVYKCMHKPACKTRGGDLGATNKKGLLVLSVHNLTSLNYLTR